VLYGFALQIPALSERLSLASATGVFRLHLWQASLNMFWENPWFGVGLDNFLYAYRGRYILAEAWQEPNLNHPHNLVLDFATRLGIFGLLSGGWMLGETGRGVWHNLRHTQADQYLLAIGLAGGLLVMVVHGLVDHSFFLVDLAYAFFLILGLTHWLGEKK
jgi:O-antigen ligase